MKAKHPFRLKHTKAHAINPKRLQTTVTPDLQTKLGVWTVSRWCDSWFISNLGVILLFEIRAGGQISCNPAYLWTGSLLSHFPWIWVWKCLGLFFPLMILWIQAWKSKGEVFFETVNLKPRLKGTGSLPFPETSTILCGVSREVWAVVEEVPRSFTWLKAPMWQS